MSASHKHLIALDVRLSRSAAKRSFNEKVSRGQLLRVPIDGEPTAITLEHSVFVNLPDGVVYNAEKQRLYFTNMGFPPVNDGSVSSVLLDGSDPQIVLSEGQIHTPKQMALDKVKKKLYIADREGMRIMRCNLDGTGLETLIQTGDVGDTDHVLDSSRWCVGITVAPQSGLFYWSQKAVSEAGLGRIFCAPIDSSGPRVPVCILDGVAQPVHLDIHVDSMTLFWTHRGKLPHGNAFSRLKLDKSGVKPAREEPDPDTGLLHEVLVQHFDDAVGLAYDAEAAIWYVADLGGTIWSVDSEGGKQQLFHDEDRAFTGLSLVCQSGEDVLDFKL